MKQIDRLVCPLGCSMFHVYGSKDDHAGEDIPAACAAALEATCEFCGTEDVAVVYMDEAGVVLGAICNLCCAMPPGKSWIDEHAGRWIESWRGRAHEMYARTKLLLDPEGREDWSWTMAEQIERIMERKR